jgi:DNA primase|tara:strand:+ start:2012 stop:3841 length:1830 start_codon:yes stop_codon:yes gene_type:complete
MKFSTETLNEIKDKISVSQVVEKTVQLKKRGKEFVGLSPFTKERTPSFTVNDEKQFYHCFSTNKHGDIFTFLVEVGGLSFPEAVEKLADEAGVQLRTFSPAEEEKFNKSKKLYEALEISKSFFSSQIFDNDNSSALKYLKNRGLSNDIINSYEIGYAPKGNKLEKFLISKGVSHEIMTLAGMTIKDENKKDNFYDRFRNRIIFPIRDIRNRVVGFGGRVINAEDQPKYLNSPETPVFHKGGLLYNFSKIRPNIKNNDNLIVVEGYMDVVSLASKGLHNAVAPLGTALTETQLNLLWKETDSPIICFDGDKAGKQASFRASEIALKLLKPNKTLRFINLPDNLDPDDYIKNNGLENFNKYIKNASPLTVIIWDSCLQESNIKTPEGKAGFETLLRRKLNLISDKSIKRHYGLLFKEMLDKFFYSKKFDKKISKFNYNERISRKFNNPLKIKNSILGSGGQLPSDLEALVISGILIFPRLIKKHFEILESFQIENLRLRDIRDNLLVFIKKDYSELNIDLIKEFVQKNYQTFFEKDLRFANIFWQKKEGINFDQISEVWLEILKDDQHIKSLIKDIETSKDEIKNEEDERRFIDLIKNKDKAIKLITEKYG